MIGFVMDRRMVDRNRHRMVHHQAPVRDSWAMDLNWDRALHADNRDSMMEMVIDGDMVFDWDNRLMNRVLLGLDNRGPFDCMDRSYY